MTPRQDGLRVTLDTLDLDRIEKSLRKKARDLQPFFLGRLDPKVSEFFRKQFATEGSHGGTPWAPLSPLTRALRDRAGQGRGGIGRDSNTMWAAFTKGMGPGAIRTASARSYERGADVPHARFFHGGWRISLFGRPTGREAPARPIIPDPMPATVIDEWAGELASYLEDL